MNEATPTDSRTWGKEWAAAMVQAQMKFPAISKSADVTVSPKNSSAYSYSYAPFDLIISKVQPVLGEAGLAVIQDEWIEPCEMVDGDGKQCVGTMVSVMCTIVHTSGQYREYRPLSHRVMDIRIHDLGGITSYLRRYSFLASLRLAPTDEDDDGKAEMEKGQGRAVVAHNKDFHSPKPDTSQVNTKMANEYAKKIIAAINDGKARQAADLRAELSEDAALFTVVWSMLAKPLKDKFNDLLNENMRDAG
jgi:hypothetical protein